jgi:hypothetical protein
MDQGKKRELGIVTVRKSPIKTGHFADRMPINF